MDEFKINTSTTQQLVGQMNAFTQVNYALDLSGVTPLRITLIALVSMLGLLVLGEESAWAQSTLASQEEKALIGQNVSASPSSQGEVRPAEDAVVSLHLDDVSIEEAVRHIAELAGLKPSYGSSAVADKGKVTLDLEQVTVSEALHEVTRGVGLEALIFDDRLVLFESSKVEPMNQTIEEVSFRSRMQQGTISGTVTDSLSGEPIPGVNVVIAGTQQGSATDAEGQYTISSVEPGTYALRASFVGYSAKTIEGVEVQEGQTTQVDFQLVESAVALEEVVAVGYGTMRREELTSSVTSVSTSDFIAGAVNDPIQMIDGKVAGLTMGTAAAGDPNAGSSLQIRGMASVNAGTEPLIVVDGVPGRDLSSIPKDEIESVTVLKDGASSAIYGTRGANGVVIVTTKTGHGGDMSISYDGHVSFNSVANKPEVLSAEEFVSQGRSTTYDPSQANSLPHSYNFYDLLLNDSSLDIYHNLAINGGTAESNYRLSMNYRDSEGIDFVSRRNDYGGRLNFSHSFTDNITILGNLYANKSNRSYTNYEAFNQAIKVRPTEPLYTEDESRYHLFSGHQYFNPVALLEYNIDEGEGVGLSGDVTFQVDLMSNLSTSLMIAENYRGNKRYFYSSSLSRESRDNQYNGRAEINQSRSSDRLLEWTADYMQEYNNHSIELLAGYSYQDFTSENSGLWNADFASDGLLWNNLGGGSYHSTSGGQVAPSSSKSTSRLIGFFGRVNYNYDRTYLLSASVRREGSSKFGENNKWGLFPGVSVGWVVSNMEFFDGVAFVDELKLRASYGVTGREDIASLLSVPTYSIHSSYNMGGGWLQSWGPSGNPNPDLKWETSVNTNVGFDLAAFGERLALSLDLYNRETRDLLFLSPAPKPPAVYGSTWSNIGSIRNRGIEAAIDVTAVHRQNFRYSTSIIASYGKSTMLSISDDVTTTNYIDQYYLPAPGNPGPIVRLEEGQEIGSFHMYRHAGIDEEGNFLIYNADGEVIRAQDKSEDDKQFVGNGIPDITMSWTNNFEYGNFDLTLYLQGTFLWDVVNLHQMYYGLQNTPGNVLRSAYGRNADITAEKEASSYFMERGDFISLRNVTLGYTLPPSITSRLLQRARLYLDARNLFTITESTVIDPAQIEVNGLTPGIQSMSFYPSTQSFTLGVQLAF